jgi:murein DD-endopeptidase MepM/ murein hydrolase activator NlpD
MRALRRRGPLPQHWVGRPGSWLRVLILSVTLALVAAPTEVDPSAGGAASPSPADAARFELLRTLGVGSDTIEARFGGSGEWQTGTLAVPAGTIAGQDEPRVFLYVARRGVSGWTAAIEGSSRFLRFARQARHALAGTTSAELLTRATEGGVGSSVALSGSTGDGSAGLSLPWARGQTWRLTGGPHNFHGGQSRPWSSLDFAGPEPGVSVKVRAARDGVVVRPCANLVQIRHGDGWATSYYHLSHIAVKAGQTVSRGQFLGRTSNASGCGGMSSGPHVHFSLLKNGSFVNISGHTIGGWTVSDGAEAYDGCMVRNGDERCAPNGRIYNDGAIGTSSSTRSSTRAFMAD